MTTFSAYVLFKQIKFSGKSVKTSSGSTYTIWQLIVFLVLL